jgi:hypothetical protein
MLRVGAVVTLAVGGAVALAAPAAAATFETVSVWAASANDSADVKSATAYCPTGTRILGGGAVMNGNIEVHITGMMPDPVANSFTAYAAEHGPGDWPWHVRAYGICGPEPAGLVYVSAFTGGDSATSRSDYAWCPAGRKVLGVGARVTAPDSREVLLTYVKPTGTGNGAETGAVEMTGGYAGNWWLHSWAVCANELPGWSIVAAPNDPGHRSAARLCPYPQTLTGGGAYISLSAGKVYLTKIRIDLWSDPDTGAVWPGGVAVAVAHIGRAPEGPGHDYYLKAYGVCVD